MKIFISNNPQNLEAALKNFNGSCTVEAEYGSTLVQGSILTLAHHGERAGRPCPCSIPNLPRLGIDAIGVSHFDLDTLGGVMAIMGRKPEAPEFWSKAAFVDVNGVHKLQGASPEVMDSLNAFWAWSEGNRLFPERDGSVTDVTEFFEGAMSTLEAILRDGDSALLQAGREWAEAKAQLDEDSLVETIDGVQLRSSGAFVNHLYGGDTRAIVAFSTKFKSITVSVPDAVEGFSCGTFLQELFGPEAGGHAGIGGTPRGVEYSLDDAREVAVKLAETLA